MAGRGLAHLFEDYVRERVEGGDLVGLLVDWKMKLPKWYLPYPNRRHTSAAMKAFLDHVRNYRCHTPHRRDVEC